MTRPKPIFREMTGRLGDSVWGYYLDPAELPSHIVRSEGCGGGGAAGLFRLYDEMEEKDGHLFAVLQTRKNGVLSCARKVVAASSSQRDLEVARFVEHGLQRVRGFDQSLLCILDAVGKGLSVQEILWEVRDGRILARELKSRAPGRFAFGPDGSLRFSPDNWLTLAVRNAAGDASQSGAPIAPGQALPERKFIRFTFGGLYENGHGRGLCARAYWYYWFKKNNLKFWVVFNEKFGAPTIVGKYRPGATDEDRQRLLEVIESLQNDTGVTVPEAITLELLEAKRSGNVSTYRELADWCNDEISKIVLGATLTSGEGRRSGSLALGQVHERVRGEYIESDARALEDVINTQLVRWLVDFNFGTDIEAPRWTIDTTLDEAFERDIGIDRQMLAAGVALPKRYFYEKYKRPAPLAHEPALCFDDQNLFQYHLQFGIVTVNEARARLGMGPVAWGDQPVRPSENPTKEAAVARVEKTPTKSTGDPLEQEQESEKESDNEK